MTDGVCLIIPPSAFLLDDRVFVSLGILKVAACLEKAGIKVKVVDCSGLADYCNFVISQIDDFDIIGITATTPQLPAAVNIVRKIRETKPQIKIILGGPHVTLVSAAYKKEKHYGRAHSAMKMLEDTFDVLVAGDGEFAIFEAIKEDSPKLIDGDDNHSNLFMKNSDYEVSPCPARHLVDINSYKYSIDGNKSTSLIAQLGCPYGCNFCGGRAAKSLRMIRTRSSDGIIEEIEMLYRTYGFTGFMFYDDELNVNPKMIELMNKISDLQNRIGVEFKLRGFVKSELFTHEQAQAMYRAGFRWILCGFESGSVRILENINKKATVYDNSRVMDIARKNGLKVKALMSMGHAGESESTINETNNWLLKERPEDFDCTVITVYPGCPYYDQAVETSSGIFTFTAKNGDRLHSFDVDYMTTADYYKGDPNGGYKSFVFTDYLSPELLVDLRNNLEKNVRDYLGRAPVQVSNVNFEQSMGQTRRLPVI